MLVNVLFRLLETAHIFTSTACQNVGIGGMLLHSGDQDAGPGSMEFSEFYASIQQSMNQGDSGEVTPVSCGSEIEFNTNDATAGSTADCDLTVTEDTDSMLFEELEGEKVDDQVERCVNAVQEKCVSRRNKYQHVESIHWTQPESTDDNKSHEATAPEKLPPPIIKTTAPINDKLKYLQIGEQTRRSSDVPTTSIENLKKSGRSQSLVEGNSKPNRFTTTVVKEDEHTASLSDSSKFNV